MGAEGRQVVIHFPWVSLCLCLQRNIWKRLKLEFAYDAQHRRIAKVVKEWAGDAVTGGFTNVVKDRRYVCDSWNMIVESSRGTEARWTDGAAGCPAGVRARAARPNQLDHTTATGNGLEGSTVVRTQVWGLDLNGTMQGAGGVGGLLAVRHGGQTYVPLMDGNGNVMGLQGLGGAKDGQTVARYDYDAFGNRITNTAPELGEDVNPFGFSTKFTDEETELVYYGYRYYAPEMGRWVSRDPIGERGGINLYGVMRNGPLNRWDVLGLAWPQAERPGLDASGEPYLTERFTDKSGKVRTRIRKCNIVIFFGHNGLVPQTPILNEPCSAGSTVSCGGRLNNTTPGWPESPIPGTRPAAPNQQLNRGYELDLFAKHWEKAAKHAKSICKSTAGCCERVKVSVDCSGLKLWERLPGISMYSGICSKIHYENCKK